MTVAASQAALLLAQGAGRLLRTMSDRGVVAVLDPRLVTARYGDFLRKSLPPFWTTTDPALVRAALRRLSETPRSLPARYRRAIGEGHDVDCRVTFWELSANDVR
jgi:ATP-dependent DNA helicase DinG